MKITIAILACMTLAPIALAQTSTTAKSERVERYTSELSDYGRKPYRYEPRPVVIYGNDGIRTYNTQAEADMGEKLLREKQVSTQKSFESFNKSMEKRAEERRDNAMWKLLAFGAGLFIGVMRIIWGVIAG